MVGGEDEEKHRGNRRLQQHFSSDWTLGAPKEMRASRCLLFQASDLCGHIIEEEGHGSLKFLFLLLARVQIQEQHQQQQLKHLPSTVVRV